MRVASSDWSMATAAFQRAAQRSGERLQMQAPPPPRPQPPPPIQPPCRTCDDDAAKPSADQRSTRILRILQEQFGVTGVKLLSLDMAQQSVAMDYSASGERLVAGQAGFQYDAFSESASLQATAFAASGSFRTEDGREFAFSIESLQVVAQWSRSSVSMSAGAPPPTDPLAIDLGGGFGFDGGRMPFDLNGTGIDLAMPRLHPGAGWLAFDRDGSGKIENGGELFGPRSGNGFGELAALDADRDGDVDESDPAWKRLGVLDGNGAWKLLGRFGIGALLTDAVAAPLRLPDQLGQDAALQRRMGLYLGDDGRAGRVAQLDLVA